MDSIYYIRNGQLATDLGPPPAPHLPPFFFSIRKTKLETEERQNHEIKVKKLSTRTEQMGNSSKMTQTVQGHAIVLTKKIHTTKYKIQKEPPLKPLN